jgi:hypothetical protein
MSERANRREGTAASLVHRARGLDHLLQAGVVQQ